MAHPVFKIGRAGQPPAWKVRFLRRVVQRWRLRSAQGGFALRQIDRQSAAVHGGGQLGLAERWNGRRWKVQRTPVLAHGHGMRLWSVSCTARNACVAVGEYRDRAGPDHAISLRWSGRGWRRLRVANDSHANLTSVSCAANNACTAIGHTRGRSVARSWNGAHWTQQPLPTNGRDPVDISCATATHCTVVGSGNPNPLAISYS